MDIQSPCVVSLVWRLEDAQGQLIDELTAPMPFFVGGHDLLPKVEEALQGQTTGFQTRLHLEPEHAYGDYRAERVCFEDRRLFPESIEVGMEIEGLPEGALTPDMDPNWVYTVTDIYPDHVVLDANHPLAGLALVLDLTVHGVREASDDETRAASVLTPMAYTGLAVSPRPSDTLH